jgi:hypothetical protein
MMRLAMLGMCLVAALACSSEAFSQAKNDVIAAKWQLAGVKAWTIQGAKRGRVVIITDKDDPREQLAAATLVAERLTSQGYLDYASIFVSSSESGCPTPLRVEHASKAQVMNLTGGKVWRVTAFRGPDMEPLDIDAISRPAGFNDAAAEYEKVCPRSGNCEYGITGC